MYIFHIEYVFLYLTQIYYIYEILNIKKLLNLSQLLIRKRRKYIAREI